jgi:hypothetical protein
VYENEELKEQESDSDRLLQKKIKVKHEEEKLAVADSNLELERSLLDAIENDEFDGFEYGQAKAV